MTRLHTMFKVGGWLKGHTPGHAKSLDSLSELAQTVTHIMADDIESAEEHLSKGSSPFHQLGAGVCVFMRATLGFEPEIVREAANALSVAENSAYEYQRRAGKDSNAYQSAIYPPGTEYAVCQAEAQLMSAVVGVLNESLTEAIKSFYKLRKAYLALESVMENEKKFVNQRSTNSVNSIASRPATSTGTSAAVSAANLQQTTLVTEPVLSKATSVEPNNVQTVGTTSNPTPSLLTAKETQSDSPQSAIEYFERLTLNDQGTPGADIATFSDKPVDIFILSGSNFCFGMLLLMLSFIPPSFASLLKIVGFTGDRERGMRMLWQATKFHNIHGAMAGVVLMGYLNGFTNFCDIIPSQGQGAYPKERCIALLRYMRERYPKSHLWLLEEARMLASEKQLERAVESIAEAGESKLKQLEALSWFERSLNNMYMHEYEAVALSFAKCATLNNWSHGLYYHIIAASYVELYRRNKTTNPEEAKKYGAKAEEYMKMVIPNTGKKKFMARQLPFDVFVVRKIQKWEARAKAWDCDLVDAVGVSPLEEMIYFWNGYKRMRDDHLQVSLANLAWSESAANPHWEKEGPDEKSILNVLRAATLRNMDQTAKAKAILEQEVLPVDRALLTGNFKDNWSAPCARYEMAANIWREADVDGHPEDHPEMLVQCKNYLEEVTRWSGFDLDARIGMKITTGKETLRKLGVQC
ncbi:Mitochondrial outer membrane iml2 [Pyrenophora seminiperda CCB06]|uniref:Inclusion body clearance protein IML2 n=1 Tax=Pyrenophora seminiperda CCB06 TaxID=1302712 RepID=A0A3M7M3D3_9PLEO|nr:Mitochondrial outer membrane iml2 [Pyrenophora seminiperda CCB06]